MLGLAGEAVRRKVKRSSIDLPHFRQAPGYFNVRIGEQYSNDRSRCNATRQVDPYRMGRSFFGVVNLEPSHLGESDSMTDASVLLDVHAFYPQFTLPSLRQTNSISNSSTLQHLVTSVSLGTKSSCSITKSKSHRQCLDSLLYGQASDLHSERTVFRGYRA